MPSLTATTWVVMASCTLAFIVIIRSVSVLASVEREAGSGQKRIAVSGRSKTASGSARLMIPARRPSASTTGSRLTLRLPMSRAASSTAFSGMTVAAGPVIRSPAVIPRLPLFLATQQAGDHSRQAVVAALQGSLGQHLGLGDEAGHLAVVVQDGERADPVLAKGSGHPLERRVPLD